MPVDERDEHCCAYEVLPYRLWAESQDDAEGA
jgi:hypothetical protein